MGALIADPALDLAARLLLVLLFAAGLWHKLRRPQAFLTTLANYRLVPASLVPAAGWAVIAAEIVTVVALVRPGAAGGWLAAALLVLYTGAIAINLYRGRTDIDCGCSGPALRQTLSGWLLGRNGLLLVLATVAVAPAGSRALTALDWFSALSLCAIAALLYVSANQLLVIGRRLA